MAGTSITIVFAGLAVTHAVLESRSFARAAGTDGAGFLGGAPANRLWLVSCLAFLAFEVGAAVEAANIEGLTFLRVAATIAGGLACLAGVRLRCLAIESLGAAFAGPPSSAPAPVLAVSGVFAIVRHPSELGLLLFAAGLAAVAASPVTLGLFAASILPFMGLRIAEEERWLRAKLAVEHRSYRVACPRLIWPRTAGWLPLSRLITKFK